MRHRIFIAISLPEKIKEALANYQSKWLELPIRWTKKDNIHITLEFLGYLTNDELLKVLDETKKLVSKHQAFSVTLNKICYGPPGKKPPRMIWVVGDKIKELNFSPHITLGRIRAWEFRKIEPTEVPQVDEDINLTFEVNSIEVIESVLRRTGPNYTVLQSYPF